MKCAPRQPSDTFVMKRTVVTIHVIVLLLSFLPVALVGQTVKCRVEKDGTRPPKYSTGWHAYSSNGTPRTLFLAISVDPGHFRRADMVALARTLNRVYCKEPRLVVAVLDDHRAARAFSPTTETEWFQKHIRGYYDLDRDARKETISFSTEPGKPRDEIKIALN
jgi:hypothetical protein